MGALDLDDDLIDYDDDLEIETQPVKLSIKLPDPGVVIDANNKSYLNQSVHTVLDSKTTKVLNQPDGFLLSTLDDELDFDPEIGLDNASNVNHQSPHKKTMGDVSAVSRTADLEDEIDYDDWDLSINEPLVKSVRLDAVAHSTANEPSKPRFPEPAELDFEIDYSDSDVAIGASFGPPDHTDTPIEITSGDAISTQIGNGHNGVSAFAHRETAAVHVPEIDFDAQPDEGGEYVEDGNYTGPASAHLASATLPKAPSNAAHITHANEDEISYTDDDEDTAYRLQTLQDAADGDKIIDIVDIAQTQNAEQPGFDDSLDQTEVDLIDRFDEDEPAIDEQSIPNVIVSYKGVEYPLLPDSSSDCSMAFFRDQSIMDWTIYAILAGFRKELSDDIDPDDELVFQIDVLGLEYAESSSKDCLTGVTLRQLLQIFDQLVTNQNIDPAPSVFTFLSTKLHPEKRLETLIEKTYAGNTLDAVAHYFRAPVLDGVVNQNATSDLEKPIASNDQSGATGDHFENDYQNLGDVKNDDIFDEGHRVESAIDVDEIQLDWTQGQSETRTIDHQDATGGYNETHDLDVYLVGEDDDYKIQGPGSGLETQTRPIPTVTLDSHIIEFENDDTVDFQEGTEAILNANAADSPARQPESNNASAFSGRSNIAHSLAQLPEGQVARHLQTPHDQVSEGEVEDIDWGDENDTHPPPDTTLQSSFTTLSKRTRTEEESIYEVDEGQDVKRRRP